MNKKPLQFGRSLPNSPPREEARDRKRAQPTQALGSDAPSSEFVTTAHVIDGMPLTQRQYDLLSNYKRPADLTPATTEEIRRLFGI